jgi:hypothetical protein
MRNRWAGALRSGDGSGPDRSKECYWWCYLALQWHWSIEDTEARLLEVSEKARDRVRLGDPRYVHQTVLNAAAALARNPQRGRGSDSRLETGRGSEEDQWKRPLLHAPRRCTVVQ